MGYNAQFGQIVVGLEADAELASASGDGTLDLLVGLPGDSVRTSAEESWRGSVRARLGYAIDTFMPYITGGVAWSDWDLHSTLNDVDLGGFEERNSDTLVGWTIGAGMEYAFTPNLIGRLEYRYTDFGSSDNNVFNGVFPGVGSGATTSISRTVRSASASPTSSNLQHASVDQHRKPGLMPGFFLNGCPEQSCSSNCPDLPLSFFLHAKLESGPSKNGPMKRDGPPK